MIRDLEETVKTAPTAEGYIKLAGCYEDKSPQKAIDAYKRAIEVDGDSATANFYLGSLYLDMKEYDYAEKALKRALAIDPNGETVDIKDLKKKIEKAVKKSR